MNKFPEDAASGGAPVAGWPRRMFLYGRTGRVAHSDGPIIGLVFLRAPIPALARSQANRQARIVQKSALLEEGWIGSSLSIKSVAKESGSQCRSHVDIGGSCLRDALILPSYSPPPCGDYKDAFPV